MRHIYVDTCTCLAIIEIAHGGILQRVRLLWFTHTHTHMHTKEHQYICAIYMYIRIHGADDDDHEEDKSSHRAREAS